VEHFHYRVPGWFTFPQLYAHMVQRYDNAHFVEIGAFQGASTSFMAVEIINSKKNIKLTTVDIWNRYTVAGLNLKDPNSVPDDFVWNLYKENIKPVEHIVESLRLESLQASKLFADDSLDFIFIDANHEYEAVLNDIKYWYPKLKNGGHIAGHDYYNDEGVRRAVRQFFNKNDDSLFIGEQCWCTIKQ
jgi:predicted O-methyltransferase YrrM